MQRPQPYDPSRYAPHAGYAAGAATQYAPQGGQRYLPPPPATPRAYDDPYDDYDSDDSYDRRRRAHKSKSETGLRRYNSRGSSRGGRSERSGRDRDADDDEEEGERGHHHDEEKKGPQHKTAATIAGALIGGLAGYQISNRKGKPESFHTIAGAIVGAVGAREADKWYEGRREEKKEHEKRHREERDEEKEDRYNDRNDRYQF
ncbi:MAG: hypothetical protein INR71_06995 [Terriglobus roseus]|nr:hypothetical protein [Terriglobus roseus]